MSEINIISRTQHIIVDPIISSVDVVELDYRNIEDDQLQLGSVLSNSFPATINTGNITSTSPEIVLWNFALPAAMKVGDHARLRFQGSIGDLLTGGTAIGWWFRLYLNNVKVTEMFPTFSPLTGWGTTPQRFGFTQEFDLAYETASSAWVWHRHSQAAPGSNNTTETAIASTSGDGVIHTLACYANPLVNLANLPIKITTQPGSAPASSLRTRGLMLEHLIAP